MIDSGFFRRFYIASSIIGVVLAAGAYALWQDPRIAGGVLAGSLFGLVPFLSWHLTIAFFFNKPDRRKKMFGIAITVLKYGVIGVSFYFLVTKRIVHPYALFAGILAVSTVCITMALGQVSAMFKGGTA